MSAKSIVMIITEELLNSNMSVEAVSCHFNYLVTHSNH